jgi:hypothetical protein
MKNYGLNIYKEIAEQSREDHVYGGLSQPCITNIEPEEREKYLPKGEVQRGTEDFMSCATMGPINILEAKFNWLLRNKKLSPENEKWLKDNGYITSENKVEFSDRYISILSGTTRDGNSLKAPLQAIHEFGLIPKSMLPANESMDFDDFHNVNDITPEMKPLGLDFLSRFPMEYEKVYTIHSEELLKEDFLDDAGYAWPTPIDGVYPKTDNFLNHCCIRFDFPKYRAFDNYVDSVDGDFIKQLAPDYNFLDYGYRIKILKEIIPAKSSGFSELFKSYLKVLKRLFS